MVKLYVLAHLSSCNLGDRQQGRVISSYLDDLNSLAGSKPEITYINFSDEEDLSVEYFFENLNGEKIKIHNPSQVPLHCDILLVLSGSFNNDTYWVTYAKKLLPHVQKMIVWGGFSGVDNDQAKKELGWLCDEKITLLGRGKDDCELFDEITETKGRSHISGDPIYSYTCYKEVPLVVPNYNIFIGSVFFYNHDPTYFFHLVETSDIVIFIDTHTDYEIYTKVCDTYPGKIVMITYEISDVVDILRQAKTVVSNRLHGGVLSFAMGIPTIFVCPDNAKRYTKSFKYHNIALGGLEGDKPLCKVHDLEDDQNVNVWNLITEEEKQQYQTNNKLFREKVLNTIRYIKKEITNLL